VTGTKRQTVSQTQTYADLTRERELNGRVVHHLNLTNGI